MLIIGNLSIDPEPLGPTAAGTAPKHTMDGRSLSARLGQNILSSLQTRFSSFVRFACKPETIQSQCGIIYSRDIVRNVMFVSIA